ncbi:MAG: CotH kinase family protein [Verrucomicrobia bacterium]|nr:CotH kinase family protein [Verrucomicrobiota bacterium]
MLMLAAGAVEGRLWISEFVAVNVGGLRDEDRETSDWVEIYNGGSTHAALDGWHLTDDPTNMTKWRFPAATLLPGQFLVVFASGKDRDAAEWHTNFKLSGEGGFVALVRPDGTTVEHAYDPYPPQHPDVAYGMPGGETTVKRVGADSEARYVDSRSGHPGAGWVEHGFDDSGWLRGANGIGYATEALGYDLLLRSPLPGTPDALFARFRFPAVAGDHLQGLAMCYDDGFAAFLNGVRIASANAPSDLGPGSLAIESHEGPQAVEAEHVDLGPARHLLRVAFPDGAMASWDPVSATGDTLEDATGGHPANLQGPEGVVDAERGPVLRFGGDDVAVAGFVPGLAVLDFTVSVWVHVTEGEVQLDRLISWDNVDGGAHREVFALRTSWNNGGRPMFQVSKAQPPFLIVAEADRPLRTGWHHLAGVRRAGEELRIYVDGVLRGRSRDYIEGALSNDAPVSIGGYAYRQYEGEYFRGLVDEVTLFDRALSWAEIARAHAAGGIGHARANGENLLAIQVLNDCRGDAGMLLQAGLAVSVPGLNPSNAPGYLAPTPHGANGAVFPGVTPSPSLSPPDGIYSSNVTVCVEPIPSGSLVRYTLDRSIPDESSPVLDGSLTVGTPSVVRVRSWSPGLLPSPVLEVHYLDAPLFVNEFLAINTSVNPDNSDLGDFSDWIELYNTSPHPLDVSGYWLTDDADDPQRWQFPEGTVLGGDSMVLVWADGHDAAPGDLVQRDYSPYDVARLRRIHAGFKLSGAGESILLHTPGGVLLDRIDYGRQMTDVSFGRAPGSGEVWLRFGEPTPGGANTTPGVATTAKAGDVVFSIPGGLYAAARQLTLSTEAAGACVRYTTDGTRPTSRSPLYAEPICIDRSMVVRATSFQENHLPGRERVEVYLWDVYSTLPVVSLAAYPHTLDDPQVGIFANDYKKRDMPVHVDFYEANGKGEFHIDAGMSLIGWLIQMGVQKPLSIELAGRWGFDELIYPLFSDRDGQRFEAFVLRAGGQDGDVTFLREGLITGLVRQQMDLDYQAYRPVRLYLNGQYHGLYNLREKQNPGYVRALHPGVGDAPVDMIEHDIVPRIVVEGGVEDYAALAQFLETHNLAEAAFYDHVTSQIDLNEFLNYQIASVYIGRIAPNHNNKFWKAKPEGRWRWVLFDLDQMWHYSVVGVDTLAYLMSPPDSLWAPPWSTLELRSLLDNPSFRNEFIHRFAVHIHTTFAPDRVNATLDRLKSAIDPEMPLQIARWPSRIASLETWERNVEELRQFARDRPAHQLASLRRVFGLGQTNALAVSFDASRGAVLIQGAAVPPGFRGAFFEGIPVRLEAVPWVGYRFGGWDGWTAGTGLNTIEVDVAGGLQLTARFEADLETRLVPGVIDDVFTVTAGLPAWAAGGDVVVTESGRLVMEAGSTVLMPDRANLHVKGGMVARGTAECPVTIGPNPAAGARQPVYPANEPSQSSGRDPRWGALVFERPAEPIVLRHVQLSGSSHMAGCPAYAGGITAVDADLTLEHVSITNVRQPLLILGGRVVLQDSFIHIVTTGDGINVKGAQFASVENCEFLGGSAVDTDAIDYDQLAEGRIVGNRVHDFLGINNDAIDLGEGSTNVLVAGNILWNCRDKGVSVGQASTAAVCSNLIHGCGMGVAVKETGSLAVVDQCTFCGNDVAVAAYEKNPGMGAGVARVVNCILAFSQSNAVYVDALGSVTTDYCLANTEMLPGAGNLYDGPAFADRHAHDFRLRAHSSAIDAGDPRGATDPDGTRADLGAIPYQPLSSDGEGADLVITEIHYHPCSGQGGDEAFEFVELHNPNAHPVSLAGYAFVAGVEFVFPAGWELPPGGHAVVAKNAMTYAGRGYPVFQWSSGRLANEGELVVLADPGGFAVDAVPYGDTPPWPEEPDGSGPSLMLLNPGRANAAAWNWRASSVAGGTPGLPNWIGKGSVRILPASGAIEITWSTVPGMMYQLEYCPSLSGEEWMPVGDPILAAEAQTVFLHETSAPPGERRDRGFYRARVRFP